MLLVFELGTLSFPTNPPPKATAMSPKSKSPTLLTAKAVARIYGVNVATIRSWAKDGHIPGFKVEGSKGWLFDARTLPRRSVPRQYDPSTFADPFTNPDAPRPRASGLVPDLVHSGRVAE